MRSSITVPIRVLPGNRVTGQPTEGLRLGAAWFVDQVSPDMDPLGWQIGIPDEDRLMAYVDVGCDLALDPVIADRELTPPTSSGRRRH